MNKNKNKNIKIEEEGEEGGEGEEEGRRVTVPGEEEAADMYEKTLEVTGQWGYHQYEVSNFAKSEEEESKHNKVYWRSGEWIGIGPGAASRLNISSPSLSSSSPSLASSTPSLSFPFSPSSSSPSFSRISFSQHRFLSPFIYPLLSFHIFLLFLLHFLSFLVSIIKFLPFFLFSPQHIINISKELPKNG